MPASQRLELNQSQSLVMTPQLQQAIKLLQLSHLELADYVNHELEQNPLLERDDGSQFDGEEARGAGDAGEPSAASESVAGQEPDEPPALPDSLHQSQSETLPHGDDAPLDTDYENVFNHDGPSEHHFAAEDNSGATAPNRDSTMGDWQKTPAASSADHEFSLENRLSDSKTLKQHLLDQLQIAGRGPADQLIGSHIIDMLDEAGYVAGDLEALAGLLGCEADRIHQTLALLQEFDPTGVCARDLPECLALQLKEQDRFDPAMACLVGNLDLLAARELTALRKQCGVDEEDFAEMLAELKALDPKPGLSFEAGASEPLVPDILMWARPDGNWALELNPETLPRVLVNETYFAEVSAKTRDKRDRGYLQEQYQSANWLIKSLHQRATTILKVASEIVRQQDAFFRKGVHHLKPLTLKNIATEIEMHESTVSRVTANKYIVSPRGTFELRYFFTAAIAGLNGEAHSAESVRQRIKLLIDSEAPKKILSDDSIVEILRGDGVDIARRTVAKYREAMRIPSSVQRRKEKRAAL